jgi:thiol-disulfide isomerase/thioredoxin
MQSGMRKQLLAYVLAGAAIALAGWYGLPLRDSTQSDSLPVAEKAGQLAVGQMKNFTFFTPPRPVPPATFMNGAGQSLDLSAFRDSVVLVNLWATWCVPCRKEMPSLDRVQAALGGADFAVVAISVDRAGAEKAQAFLDDLGVKHLKLYIDSTMKSARAFGVTGLPVSFLVDRDGQEVGRLIGEAEWDSPEAQRLIRAVIAASRDQQRKAAN